jgi:hypothetical protein
MTPPEPRCICGPLAGSNGEDIDERPDCPRHGTTPEATAYQESRRPPWTGEDPY